MERVEIIVYKEMERVNLSKDEAEKFIKEKEKSKDLKCIVVDIDDDGEEEKSNLSCSGSGRIGKRVGLQKGVKGITDLFDK